jgi:type II secretory pathway predicted ATPase ExeA
LEDFLYNCVNGPSPKTPVLLIDEAQRFNKDLFETLRGILNYESPTIGKYMQMILFAQPEIRRKLGYAKGFRSRLAMSELERINRKETEEILRWRFTQAGGTVFPFEAEAIDTIYTTSEGNPRRICQLAQYSLEAAAALDMPITPELVLEAAKKRLY